MRSGISVLVIVIVASTAFGLWRRVTDGRIRGVNLPTPTESTGPTHEPPAGEFAAGELGVPLGQRATLVQFSTAFCQPCRATRRLLGEVAGQLQGVTHVEIDAEDHLDLVRRLDVRRTPTIFVLDATGQIVRRAVGQPRKADVIAALGEAIPG